MNSQKIHILYDFLFDDKSHKEFTIEYTEPAMLLAAPQHAAVPNWTVLDNEKCKDCPLNSTNSPFCPLAKHLCHLVEEFSEKESFKRAEVTVTTQERTYAKNVSIQEGLFSIFGLMMPLSGCPQLRFLAPMARFHLPFSSQNETIVRSTSFYLLGQYFAYKKGKTPDLELKELTALYTKVQQVNLGILRRIKSVVVGDADQNAITILQNFAQLLSMAVSSDLSKIEPLFHEMINS
jgi:hypothetical protein